MRNSCKKHTPTANKNNIEEKTKTTKLLSNVSTRGASFSFFFVYYVVNLWFMVLTLVSSISIMFALSSNNFYNILPSFLAKRRKSDREKQDKVERENRNGEERGRLFVRLSIGLGDSRDGFRLTRKRNYRSYKVEDLIRIVSRVGSGENKRTENRNRNLARETTSGERRVMKLSSIVDRILRGV